MLPSGLSGLSASASIQNAWSAFRVAPTWAVTLSGEINIGLTTAGQRWFLTTQNDFLIRQDGTVTQVQIPVGNLSANWTEFYILIWRKNGSVYDKIATSANLRSQVTTANTVTTLSISPNIEVMEGDYIGYSIVTSDTDSNQLQSVATTVGQTRYVDSAPSNALFDWGAQSGTENSVKIGIFIRMPPRIAEVGDSIISGSPAHNSYVQSSITVNTSSTIGFKLQERLGWLHQNWGIGGETTTQIAARVTNVTELPPGYLVIEGGVNDISGGVINQATFIANWTTILNACVGIIPIVIPILPWTNGTTGQMQTRDTWNAALVDLAADYPDAIVVDCSEEVGLFRAGGDAGNLWDIQAEYSADGVHYNAAGHAAIADAIYAAIIAANPVHTFLMEPYFYDDGSTGGRYFLLESGDRILLE